MRFCLFRWTNSTHQPASQSGSHLTVTSQPASNPHFCIFPITLFLVSVCSVVVSEGKTLRSFTIDIEKLLNFTLFHIFSSFFQNRFRFSLSSCESIGSVSLEVWLMWTTSPYRSCSSRRSHCLIHIPYLYPIHLTFYCFRIESNVENCSEPFPSNTIKLFPEHSNDSFNKQFLLFLKLSFLAIYWI